MKSIEHNIQTIKITSSEIGHLWQTYMIESIVHHMFSYFARNVEDQNVKEIIQINIDMTKESLGLLESTFQKNNIPVPRGAKSEDVNLNAPRLYSDIYYLRYLNAMSQYALMSYTLAYAQSSRYDIREFFKHYVNRLVLVNQQVTDLLQQKGLYIRSPHIPDSYRADIVKDKSFMAGFLVDEKRPLTVMEIMTLFYDAHMNAVGKALSIGFIKVAKSPDVKYYFLKGKELSQKLFQDFISVLFKEDVSIPPSFDDEITECTESPFSDRFMLLHITYLSSFGMSTYGRAISSVQRHDLTAMYVKVMAEVGLYANEGVKIMIENQWLDQPPSAT